MWRLLYINDAAAAVCIIHNLELLRITIIQKLCSTIYILIVAVWPSVNIVVHISYSLLNWVSFELGNHLGMQLATQAT